MIKPLTTNQILSFISQTLSIDTSKFKIQKNRYLSKTNNLGEEVVVFSTGEKFMVEGMNHESDLSYAVVLSVEKDEVVIIYKIEGEGCLGALNPDYLAPSYEDKKNQIIFCVSKELNSELDEDEQDKTFVCWTTSLYYSLLGDGAIAQGGLFEHLQDLGDEIPETAWHALKEIGYPDQPESENTVYSFNWKDSVESLVNSLRSSGLTYSNDLAKDLNVHGECGHCYEVHKWDEEAGKLELNKKNLKNKLYQL